MMHNLLTSFEKEMFNDYITTTNLSFVSIRVQTKQLGAEADDVIAVYCQENSRYLDEIYICSEDVDFYQLLSRYDNLTCNLSNINCRFRLF